MNFITNGSNALPIRGYAFEPRTLRTLENAGMNGRMKHLSGDGRNVEMRPQQLGPLHRVTVNDFDELASSDFHNTSTFYLPQRTDLTVDFYVPSHGLLVQITVGQKHGVKWTEVDLAMKSGMFDKWFADHTPLNDPNNRPKLRMIFICANTYFEHFNKQNWLNSNGGSCTDTDVIDPQIEQYAWELDVELQFELHRQSPRAIREREELLRGCGN
jgi:hypothetical protein